MGLGIGLLSLSIDCLQGECPSDQPKHALRRVRAVQEFVNSRTPLALHQRSLTWSYLVVLRSKHEHEAELFRAESML